MLTVLKKAVSSLWQSSTHHGFVANTARLTPLTASISKRSETDGPVYDPYPANETSSPYKKSRGSRRFYDYKLFTGGSIALN